MAKKQEVLNMLFWLMQACIQSKLYPIAGSLQDLHATYFFSEDNCDLKERTIRLINRTRVALIEAGFDWEKEVEKIMEKNHYFDYAQMFPDYGF